MTLSYKDLHLVTTIAQQVTCALQMEGIPAEIHTKKNGVVYVMGRMDANLDYYEPLFYFWQDPEKLTFIFNRPGESRHEILRDDYLNKLVEYATEYYHFKFAAYDKRKRDPDIKPESVEDLQRRFPKFSEMLSARGGSVIELDLRSDYDTIRHVLAAITAYGIKLD